MPLILLAAVFAGVGSLPAAHAAGFPGGPGLVCLNDASDAAAPPANPCPATNGFTFDAPPPTAPQISQSQIRVGVFMNGSAPMDGFDITLITNNILPPSYVSLNTIDLTGTVLIGTPVIVLLCVNGQLVTGSTCLGADTIDTIHLAATSALGSPLTTAPTSGLLFTAIYNVTATTSAGGVPINFQTGCPGSSVAGGVCVTIANGTPVPNQDTVQNAIFDNSGGLVPWVAVRSSIRTITVVKGAPASVQVNVTSQNGFAGGFSSDIETLSAIVTPGFTPPTFDTTTLCTAPGPPTCFTTATLTLNTQTSGSYSVTVLATYVAFDGLDSLTKTLIGPVVITINVSDVAWTINTVAFTSPQTVYMAKTQGAPLLLVTAQSLGGYTGTLTYGQNNLSPGTTGMLASSFIYPAPFNLGPGQTITKAINATAPNLGSALYQARLTTTGGLAVKNSALITIKVSGFTLTTNNSTITNNAGDTRGVTLSSMSLGNPPATNGFAGVVAISNTITGPTGIGQLTATTCTQSYLLTAGGSATGTCSFTGTLAGTYTVVIKGIGGSNNDMTNSTVVTVTINSPGPPPGINISASPTSATVNAGTAATSTITVAARGAFTGTVNLSTTITGGPGTITCTLTPTSVAVPATKTSALSCNGSAGTFTVTVNAASGTATNSTSVGVTVQDFTVAANPTSVTVNSGVAGTSTMTVAPLSGFTGTVALAASTNSTNLACTLSSTSIIGGSGTSTLSCTGSVAGNYLATVTGTSSGLSHSATVVYHVVPAPDFTMSASPTSVTVNVGVTTPSTITVSPINGFTGTVNLAVTTNSTNLVCTLSSSTISGGSGTSTLSCHGSPAGNYLATVTGTSGTLSHSATVTYHVQDFTVTASPTTVSPNVGIAATSAIIVAPLNGFSGTVALAVTTNSTNLVCTLSSTSITGGSGTSTLSCTGSPAGNYLATVSGTSGTLSHSATVTYHVTNAPDFTLTASPTSVNANTGASATSTITVAPLNGFTGTVTLAVTTNSTNLVCSLSSTSITGGSGTSSLSCHGSPVGNYLATVTGTSGSLSHSATVTYHVQDFSVSANPSSVSTSVGVAGTSAITVAPVNGFNGAVALAVTTNSTNLSCTPSSTSITGGSGSSTLSCSASVAGNYLATVTGTNGALSHSASVTYHITAAADFTVTANPTSVVVTVSSPGSSTITVAPVNGFIGTVSLAVTTNSTNLSCSLSSTSVVGGSGASTLSCTGSPSGNYLATVTGTSGSLSRSAAITYHVTAAADFTIASNPTSISTNVGVAITSAITVAQLNGFSGTVSLAVTTNSTNLVCSLSSTSITGGSGSVALSCQGSPAGNYLATVTGTSGALSHSATVTYHVQDFSVAASPNTVSTSVGAAGTSTITIAPINGFGGTVGLSVTTNSTNISCTLSSNSIIGGSGTSTLSCTGSLAGNYLATVTGTTGSLSHSAAITYHVAVAPDFTIAANPTSVTVSVGVAGTSSIIISPVNGFTGTVTLSVTTNSTSLTCTLSSTSVTGGSGSSTLSCQGSPAGNYLATVTGTSGTLSHSATVVYHLAGVPDFTISASPTTVNVVQGQAGTSTITVAPVNGFTGTVTLSVTANSASLSCTLSSTSITGGSGTSTLSCTGSATGSFIATVTGTSGTLSHSVAVTYAVSPAPDFSLTASPSSVTVNVGVAGHSSISVAPLNGFTATVTLSVIANSTNLSCTLSSTSITGGSGSSTLTCTGPVAGNYLATVTGTSGALSHFASVVFHVTAVAPADFGLTANPASVTVTQGTAGTSTITVTPVNGFAGSVALSALVSPAGLACAVNPTSIVLGASQTSTLSCSGSTGIYTVTVTGTSGSLSHSAFVAFNVASTTSGGCGTGCTASLSSDATITNFTGNSTLLSFTATGQTGATAFANVTIPKSAVPSIGALQVRINGTLVTATITSNSTSYFVYFTFTFHSTFVIQISLAPTAGNPVLLTFSGFDVDDFENGLGQLQVLINGNLVVDIPAGLNHLTGSGDYRPYDNRWVNFGPFDITSLVVQGQNTILFRDPQTISHFSLVRNVTIVQGNALLLQVLRARGVYPGFSFSYTFSIPPLVITGFTASPASPLEDQRVMFTATYTGGTAPFRCLFSFGDGGSASVTGANGTCSAFHTYYSAGTFTAVVTVRGASTSDLQRSRLTIAVSGDPTLGPCIALLVTTDNA